MSYQKVLRRLFSVSKPQIGKVANMYPGGTCPVHEFNILQIYAEDGKIVKTDDIICEIEIEKWTCDIRANCDATFYQLSTMKVGNTLSVDDPLFVLNPK